MGTKFQPGDRVYVDDPMLAQLRSIIREYEGYEPPPNHTGTVDSVSEDGRVSIVFDDGSIAPYGEHETHLLADGSVPA